jgi:hypothetical protein
LFVFLWLVGWLVCGGVDGGCVDFGGAGSGVRARPCWLCDAREVPRFARGGGDNDETHSRPTPSQRPSSPAPSTPKKSSQQQNKTKKNTSEAYAAWVKAREAKDFSAFAPFLSAWIDALREKAAAIDASAPAYDVLLDDYEVGLTGERLDAVFAQVVRWWCFVSWLCVCVVLFLVESCDA